MESLRTKADEKAVVRKRIAMTAVDTSGDERIRRAMITVTRIAASEEDGKTLRDTNITVMTIMTTAAGDGKNPHASSITAVTKTVTTRKDGWNHHATGIENETGVKKETALAADTSIATEIETMIAHETEMVTPKDPNIHHPHKTSKNIISTGSFPTFAYD
jgi:hypothetical protein